MKRRKGVKQPPWPWRVCTRVHPQQWIILRCQGEPEQAVGVVLTGKQVHFCSPEPVPNLLHYLRVQHPLVCQRATS